jgi:hypothetical protein
MEPKILPPFSNRNLGAHFQVDSNFPESARTGLLHLLLDLTNRSYVRGWMGIAREFERIARVKPVEYQYDSNAREAAQKLLLSLSWDKVLDFCERLYTFLAQAGKNYVADELNRLFIEENLAFEFRDGRVERRGRAHTSTQVSRAQIVLGDARLGSARKHLNKALKYFQNVSQPDPENAVKEAVCAVEATARALFPEAQGNTLGDIIKSITGNEVGQLPKSIAQTFHGLYGFRSGGEGVAHGGTTGGAATSDLAEYVLGVAASQIILLVDVANLQEDEILI